MATRPRARADAAGMEAERLEAEVVELTGRQDECQQPGCHAQDFLQYDHVQPYGADGPTVVANLQRLCGPHDRARQVA